MIFDRFTNLKYRCDRDFWYQGGDTVGWNKTAVELYIRIQPVEDKASEPLEMKELFSPSVVKPVVMIILFVVDPKMVCCKIYFKPKLFFSTILCRTNYDNVGTLKGLDILCDEVFNFSKSVLWRAHFNVFMLYKLLMNYRIKCCVFCFILIFSYVLLQCSI